MEGVHCTKAIHMKQPNISTIAEKVLTTRAFVEPFLKDPRFHQAKHALSHYYYLERRNQIDRKK